MKSKIGWCSMTFNPVIGCKNNCSFCYARRINNRFKFIEDWNKPEWRENNFKKKFPKKPQRIFVGSMSEIYYWKKEWVERVLNKIREYPQHNFQFLTKFPDIYCNWIFPTNCWLGITVTTNMALYETDFITIEGFDNDINIKRIKFISFEPMSNKIEPSYIQKDIDWIIIGAETGNRKGKIIPKKEWIEDIVEYCKRLNIPIYLKDSLKNIYPKEIKEFPIGEKNNI